MEAHAARMRRHPARYQALAAVVGVLSTLTAGALPPSGRLILGGSGHIYAWQPGSDRLEDRTSEILGPLSLDPVKDLALLGDGQRIIVIASGDGQARSKRGSGGQHRGGGGRAVVLDTSGPAPRILQEIAFEGEGDRVLVSPGREGVFVLAQQKAAGGPPNAGRAWIHAIDPQAGRVVGSTGIQGPVLGMAIDPQGKRIFLSREGRIATCTTDPLLNSWFYKSPGPNGALAVRPGTEVLLALRGGEVALFDPRALAARSDADRHHRDDDATAVVRLPSFASQLAVSQDGRLAAALGVGSVTFIDLDSKEAHSAPDSEELRRAAFLSPLMFTGGPAGLLLGVFPDLTVVHLEAPQIAAQPEPEPPAPAPPSKVPIPIPPPEPSAGPSPPPATPAAPELPSPPPSPPPPPAPRSAATAPIAIAEAVLRGRVTGSGKPPLTIVVYGPDSIVREQARVHPGPDGSWEIPLPPPGVYRLLPLAEGSGPLRSRPNFHTVVVRTGEGWQDLDFEILRR